MGEPRREPSLEDDIFAVASDVEPDRGARLRIDPPKLPSRRTLWPGAAGFATFALVDAVMMLGPLMSSDRPSLLPQMVCLLLFAFGLGGLLVWRVGGRGRPFGLGMMAGWVFLTLVSVGFLTGIPLLP